MGQQQGITSDTRRTWQRRERLPVDEGKVTIVHNKEHGGHASSTLFRKHAESARLMAMRQLGGVGWIRKCRTADEWTGCTENSRTL